MDLPTSAILRRECHTELARVQADLGPDGFVCLATIDGHLVASSVEAGFEAVRIAAMTASLLGLCEAFTSEARLDRNRHCAICADSGAVVVVRVPDATSSFALSVRAASSVTLGALLRAARDSAERLAPIIDLTFATVLQSRSLPQTSVA